MSNNSSHTIHVNRSDNLASLIKAFPDAQVFPLITGENEDGWRVEITIAGRDDDAHTQSVETSLASIDQAMWSFVDKAKEIIDRWG